MISKNPKIIFLGTPEFAADILNSLIKNKFNVTAVFSQPDKKIGRKKEIILSPVKKLALDNKIRVYQPENLKDRKVLEEIEKIKPDLIIVAAYGKILPKNILKIPKYGSVNIHASLLPKYRGASPVQCAIFEGEKETGITLILMNEKMDEGDILMQKIIAIGENETADILTAKLGKLGAKMVVQFIPYWLLGKVKPVPQRQKEASYCKPIGREDGKIDWRSCSAEKIYRQWRAYQPWPGIFSRLSVKSQLKRLKLLEIGVVIEKETGEKPGKIIKYNQDIAVQAKKGLVVLKKIQLEGKKELAVSDFARGFPEFIGGQLE